MKGSDGVKTAILKVQSANGPRYMGEIRLTNTKRRRRTFSTEEAARHWIDTRLAMPPEKLREWILENKGRAEMQCLAVGIGRMNTEWAKTHPPVVARSGWRGQRLICSPV